MTMKSSLEEDQRHHISTIQNNNDECGGNIFSTLFRVLFFTNYLNKIIIVSVRFLLITIRLKKRKNMRRRTPANRYYCNFFVVRTNKNKGT